MAGLLTGIMGAVGSAALSATPAAAAPCKVWSGTGVSANWNEADNWTPVGVPGPTDCAVGGNTFTNIVIDSDVTVLRWGISSMIIAITVTNDATVSFTDPVNATRMHELVASSGRMRFASSEQALIGLLTVSSPNTFTITGETDVRIDRGFIQGTLFVGSPGGGGVGRNGHVSMDVNTQVPGLISVLGPTSSTLRLTGTTKSSGIGGNYGTNGRIVNGAGGHTTLVEGAKLIVKANQHLSISGPFTVEYVTIGATLETEAGGVVSLDAGFTNLSGGTLNLSVYRLGGTIEVAEPIVTSFADLTYRSGDFTHNGTITRPSINRNELRVHNSFGTPALTFPALENRGNITVGKGQVNAATPPVSFAVVGAGLDSIGGGITVFQGHTLDCTVTCTGIDSRVDAKGNITGVLALTESVPNGGLQSTITVGGFNHTLPRGRIDALSLDGNTNARVEIAQMSASHPAFLNAVDATIAGKLTVNNVGPFPRTFAIGDQFPVLQTVNPIVGAFDNVEIFAPTAGNLTLGLVTTPTTITAVVIERPELTFATISSSFAEGTGSDRTVTVAASLSHGVGYPLAVPIAFQSGGTLALNADVRFPAGQFIRFPTGFIEGTSTIELVGDAIDEVDEFTRFSSGGSVVTNLDNEIHTFTIVDDDGINPVISVGDASKTEGSAFSSNATVTLTRTGSTVAASSVTLSTSNGTATAGSDYTAASQTVTFAIGETSKTVPVVVLADVVPELDETVKLTLTNPSGATIGTAKATLTIANDDGPPPIVSVADVIVTEGTGGATSATVTVTRTGSLLGSINAQVVTSAGSATSPADFTAAATIVSFAAGQASRTFTVPIVTDGIAEDPELVNLTIANTTGATIGQKTAVVRILDDDPLIEMQAATEQWLEGASGTSNLTIFVSRSTTLGPNPVSVKLSTANGTAVAPGDFTAVTNQTVNFGASTFAFVTVPIKGDSVAEADETFTATISAPSAGAVLGTSVTTTATIINDDGGVPALTIGDQSVVEGSTGSAAGKSFAVTRSGGNDGTVTFQATTTAGSATAPADYTTTSSSLTMAAGIDTVNVVVPVVGDSTPENDETFTITLSAAVGATIADGTGVITVLDDDPRITVDTPAVTKAEGNAGSSNASVTLRRSTTRGPATPSVKVNTTNGTAVAPADFTAITNQTVTFAPGAATATVNIPIVGDTAGEANETFTAAISAPSAGAVIGAPTAATVTITNDDGPGFHALAPGRLLDSRDGTGTTQQKWQNAQTRSVQITGKEGVPASGVSAVVVNITVTGATAGSHLRLFPTGTALPDASSINFDAGQTIANLAMVKLGTGGKIDIFNNSGQTDVLADVVGYYDDGTANGDRYTPLVPGRLLDSRDGTGTTQQKWQNAQTRSVQVTGQEGVPAGGVSAVVLNVTVTGATAGSHLRLFPTGTPLPDASSINFNAGQTIANGAVVKLGTGGKIDIFNNSGQTDVIADVVGYFSAAGGAYTSLAPGRVLDSRDGTGTTQQKWQNTQTRSVQITGQNGVPATGVSAVVVNVTVTGATAGSHLRLFPTGTALPDASSINFNAGQTIANLVVVKVGTGGKIDIFNNSGQTDVIADVVGYFSA